MTAKSSTSSETLSFADATALILGEVGTPLHYRDITEQALERNLIQTEGKTPQASLNAILAVDIKQKGESSRFIRVKPGIFGLRSWGMEQTLPTLLVTQNEDSDRRVKIPHYSTYTKLRSVLPVWNGRKRSQITGLRSTLSSLFGSPQDPVDWTNPDAWIPQRLKGQDRDLAEAIWQKSEGVVNPRYIHSHWLLACTYQLLTEDSNGQMLLTERGKDFIAHPQGDTVALVDEGEGLLKILTIVAEKGTGRKGDFVAEWAEYLKRYSRIGTDITIKDTLGRRLSNLLERRLLAKTGTTYSITDEGLNYLNQTGGTEDLDSFDELQQILQLQKQQQASVRASIQALLETMNPIAFEYLIKQLLEAMNYQNVRVTQASNDKGVDVVADIELGITSVREVVQVKRHKANIQRTVLDALRGSLYRFQAVRGTIITTGGFSKGTTQVAFEPGAPPITLIHGEKLVDLLIEHGIGVRSKTIELLELDADAFVQQEAESDE
jgi:restriction system protein